MKKRIVIAALVIAIVGAVIYDTTIASAQSTDSPHQTIISRLVERFGLNESEVQTVFDEVRDERKADMQARYEDRLNDAVASGEFTEEKKQLIIDKHEELKAEKEGMWEEYKDMTKEEMKAAFQAHHDEMQAWADENGIDLQYFHFGKGGKGGFHHGWHKGFGN